MDNPGPAAAAPEHARAQGTKSCAEMVRLSMLFAGFYVFQALSDSEGLIALPITALLDSWGWTVGQITIFFALVGLPWFIKPLYGLATDYLPIAGYRRKVYLIGSSVVAAVAFGAAALGRLDAGASGSLLALLLVASLATAFSDVVIDALMIDTGQPLGMTGRFQSIQWTAIYAASIVGAALGGRLGDQHQERAALAIAALLALLSTLLAIWFVDEQPRTEAGRAFSLALMRSQFVAVRSSGVLIAGGLLFLWNFNPFSARISQLYLLGPLSLSKTFCGDCDALGWAAAMVASIAYGAYCRRLSTGALVHGAIAVGVASTLAYLPLTGPRSAIAASMLSGFASATGTLMLLDIAARLCPVEAAGTLFALLMGVSNLATSLSQALGGHWSDAWQERLGSRGAFQSLVVVGALLTAACWLLAPRLIAALARKPQNANS